jgi:RNA 2',3'-cyclic 3'-phosphodiesterase
VAVELPPPVRGRLAEWARGVAAGAGSPRGALRALGGQSLHLTLWFLGSRPVAEIDPLAAALGACEETVGELSLGAPLWLPVRRPRALAVEVHDRSGDLARARARVGEELAGVSSWQPERRRFRPHITVVRVGRGAGAARRPGAQRIGPQQQLPATPWLSFTPEAIVLYRSWLLPDGASYEALARSELLPALG